MQRLITIIALFLIYSCAANKSEDLDFLVGTWKREGKEQYEVWEKAKNGGLIGHSYVIRDNKRSITETLAIKEVGGLLVFEATVPDQNSGSTVQFLLNPKADSILSFENKNHDFPKKIQYQKLDSHQLKITVLGDSSDGFSYIQFRQ